MGAPFTVTPGMCVAAADAAMERGIMLPASHTTEIIGAALAAAPVSAPWLPIETAPKNERVIVSDGKIVGEACLLSYPNLDGWYYADDHNPAQTPPTHWMPLPPAPTAAPSPAPQEALTGEDR